MKSIAGISMHKAGSSITEDLLVEFCRAKGFEIERMASIGHATPGLSEDDYCIQNQDNIQESGIFYCMFRRPYVSKMPKLSNIRLFVHVRDPRDCITSAYFSYTLSHVLPDDPIKREIALQERKDISEMSIDEYALSVTSEYVERMDVISELIGSHDDYVLSKYEDMVTRPKPWLRDMSKFVGQRINFKLSRKLKKIADFKVKQEDPNLHRRQITPGDHIRKLKPETVNEMTERLSKQLEAFGYL